MQTVLLLGGAGYVGSCTAHRLVMSGYRVVILDAFLHHQSLEIPGTTIIRGDYGDEQLLRSIFSSYNISIVMHFAALIEVGRSVQDPASFYENNVIKTKRLLDVMRSVGVLQCVFSSTCAIYKPREDMQHLTENSPILPLSPYGKTKFVVECLLQDYAVAYGLRYVALRYFNAAGAVIQNDILLGEQHSPETHLIPNIFAAVQYANPVTIFGDDYPTPDGTCVRDYIHVHDLARAHEQALCYLANSTNPSAAFNLGTGNGASVAQMVAMVEAVCGTNILVDIKPRRAGDVPCLVADASLARHVLGWQAQRSSLKCIVEDAWYFYRQIKVQKNICEKRLEKAL